MQIRYKIVKAMIKTMNNKAAVYLEMSTDTMNYRNCKRADYACNPNEKITKTMEYRKTSM